MYLTNDKRMNKFFGPAVFIYSNNYWRVPAITRTFFGSITLGIVSEWIVDRRKKQSFSCYSANFRLLEKTGYWDATTGAEDTYFYWNTIIHTNGDFIGVPFFLPIRMDCVEGKTVLGSLTSLYKQQLRWGWGVIIMPMAYQGMAWNKNMAVQKKVERALLLFRAYNFFLTTSLLLALSIPIMTLLNPNIEFSSISYNLPRMISLLLTGSFILQIPYKFYLWRYYGSPPKEKSLLFKIGWWVVEPLLMFVNIWTYYFIPRIQAIYEMTVGKQRKKFLVAIEARVEEKV